MLVKKIAKVSIHSYMLYIRCSKKVKIYLLLKKLPCKHETY